MEGIVRYIFEAGMLKRTARSGWWAEKVKDPESVADHVYRTGVLAFILARMEGRDEVCAQRLAAAALFHDMHESRLGDMNKITARYVTVDREMERGVWDDQLRGLPADVGRSILGLLELSGAELDMLKDADYLECAFQAKEYVDIGHKGAQTWIDNIGKRLKTKSAKGLHSRLKRMNSNSWWKGIKKLD